MPDAKLRDDVFVDALASAMDDIRREVHGALGTRTYRVFVVVRRWSGGRVGEGTYEDRYQELDPRPLVKLVTHDRLGPAGPEHEGDATLTEVSLTYSAAELRPRPAAGEEVAYRVVDTGGQGAADGWYVIDQDPVSRRGDNKNDNSDWYVHVRRTADMGRLDGVDA